MKGALVVNGLVARGKGVGMEPESNQYNASVAWFKLADLIARKEREKALSVYRLLSHSLHDRAYVLQLEADILWSLDDRGALERYRQAAFLYQKDKRWVEAVAVYEHLLIIDSNNDDVLAALIACSALANWQDMFCERLQHLSFQCREEKISEQQLIKILNDVITVVQESDDFSCQQMVCSKIREYLSQMPASIQNSIKLM